MRKYRGVIGFLLFFRFEEKNHEFLEVVRRDTRTRRWVY